MQAILSRAIAGAPPGLSHASYGSIAGKRVEKGLGIGPSLQGQSGELSEIAN
jgi:hypothetical protein